MGGQGKKRRPPLISGVEHYQDIEEENAPAEDDTPGRKGKERRRESSRSASHFPGFLNSS